MFRFHTSFFLIVLSMSWQPLLGQTATGDASAQAVQEYEQLLKRYEANRQDRQFVRPFLEVAEKHSGSKPALDSLTWVLKRFESGSHADRAISILISAHAAQPEIGQLYLHIGNNPSLKVDAFYRKVIKDNKNPSPVGRAHFRLGNYLVRQAEIAREIRANPDSLDKFKLFYGVNLTEHLQTVDLSELRKDALKQYAVAVEK